MLLYLAPGLCGVTEMIGTMLQLLLWLLLMKMLLWLLLVCPDGVVIVIVLLFPALKWLLAPLPDVPLAYPNSLLDINPDLSFMSTVETK